MVYYELVLVEKTLDCNSKGALVYDVLGNRILLFPLVLEILGFFYRFFSVFISMHIWEWRHQTCELFN
uniref:Uncharacterized protein n=1 Tax=Nelumbo nucifera TaxID=4432 RepID=A0A822XUW1_NELNU|nr:TPA_asm: hypothetical protein HUJ06_025235 [Nelumbo nucifera]